MKMTGTVRGRLDLLKAKTKCHICKRVGHWKRECPNKRGMKTASSDDGAKAKSEVNSAEVIRKEIVEITSDQHGDVWRLFEATPSSINDRVTWGQDGANDVRNSGFADTHSTGNRQILMGESSHTVEQVESPVPKNQEALISEFLLLHPGEEVLTSDMIRNFPGEKVTPLARAGVPDTACRRTLVGAYTLAELEAHLEKFGLRVHTRSERNEFRFWEF